MGGSGRVPRVMAVDDDPETLAVLARHLRRQGFAVIEAHSGPECVRLAGDHAVDVILLDLMMPNMDGFAVCRALKQQARTAEIPIIMLTARDDVEARAQGMQLGVSDFVAKPAPRRELAVRIRNQLKMLAGSRRNLATLAHLAQPKRDTKKL